MEIVDCNNHVKNVLTYFGSSCAVNSLSDKYNPLGDNSHKLCEICGSDLPGVRCTSNDPYAGYEGALMCLMDKGDIAFLKHSSIREYYNKLSLFQTSSVIDNNNQNQLFNTFSSTELPFFGGNRATTSTTSRPFSPFGGNPFGNNNQYPRDNYSNPFSSLDNKQFGFEDDFQNSAAILEKSMQRGPRTYNEFKENYELLCEDGTRRDIDDWRYCNWGLLPSHAVVTSSAKLYRPTRKSYQEFIDNLVRQFGNIEGSQGSDNSFKLFESIPRYGNRSNLLFQVT